MKLQVTQENLNRALSNVARVASSRNALPILSNVLIKTVDNRVCVAATNLNIAITHYIGSKVADPGSITVPARLMQDFVSSLSSGVIDVELEDTKLHIKTDSYNSTINGAPADEPTIEPWQRLASHATHWALYALLVAVPIAGYVGVSLFPALDVFGLFSLPAVVAPDKDAAATAFRADGSS